MTRQFDRFEEEDRDEETAVRATSQSGDEVRLRTDWAEITDAASGRWEPIAGALALPELLASDGTDPLFPVTVDWETAGRRVVEGGFVRTDDGRGERRARAVLEYLVEEGVFAESGGELVVLEAVESLDGQKGALNWAGVMAEVTGRVHDLVELADVLFDHPGPAAEDFDAELSARGEELRNAVADLDVTREAFEETERELRVWATCETFEYEELSELADSVSSLLGNDPDTLLVDDSDAYGESELGGDGAHSGDDVAE